MQHSCIDSARLKDRAHGVCIHSCRVRIYVYLELQGPGSRLDTPNGAFKIEPKAYY